MGAPRTLRTVLPILMLFLVSAFLGLPRIGGAAHDLGNDCYACHNIRSGQVWQGSYWVWSAKDIGMTSYGRPITCEVCHTNYGTGRFTSSSQSHHPVQVISGLSMATDNWTTTLLYCRDCHNADSVSLTPNLIPDLAPANYLGVAGNTGTDGYPNHDVTSPDNQVNPGEPAHLLAMRLSGSQRTGAGSGTYTKLPSSSPATAYAFCFSCHDGSNNTSRGASENILAAYVTKGHYFKSAAPTNGAINLFEAVQAEYRRYYTESGLENKELRASADRIAALEAVVATTDTELRTMQQDVDRSEAIAIAIPDLKRASAEAAELAVRREAERLEVDKREAEVQRLELAEQNAQMAETAAAQQVADRESLVRKVEEVQQQGRRLEAEAATEQPALIEAKARATTAAGALETAEAAVGGATIVSVS